MARYIRVAAAGLAVAASSLASTPADAQVACNSLPNPIIVVGSKDFEPVLQQFAVKLSAESPPTTVVTVGVSSQSTPCGGVKSLVEGTDFAGLPGRYYVKTDAGILASPCTLAAGQTADVAISEVFYESCSNVPQPKPADVVDVPGPVQSMAFVVPGANMSTRYLTYEEARTIYGCGVSTTRVAAGFLSNPMDVFCRDRAAGVQISLAKNIGVSESTIAPGCSWYADDARVVFELTPRAIATPGAMGCEPATSRCTPPASALGFVNRRVVDSRSSITLPVLLAFQALGQTQAFYPDSGPTATDRKNVRDGHYPLWGYVHLIAKTSGGNLSARVSDFTGWITGTKTSANTDSVPIEIGAGLTPQCAMKVKRTSDGGPLSPYSPSRTCTCVFEALSSLSIPAACTPCASDSGCPCGLTCQHGFCE